MRAARRFTEHKEGRRYVVASAATQAEARTMFPTRRTPVAAMDRLLKSGQHSRKIGSHVVKGRWAGMPIFTLTLEERATCPSTCGHWADCYGNKMNWSRRIEHGPELEARLALELGDLSRCYPRGFVVRLHVLGDFYSAAYVQKWSEWLSRYKPLHVYGYTAHGATSPIGAAINALNYQWAGGPLKHRWAVRFSDAGGELGTIAVEDEAEAARTGAIPCPAQTGRSDCCGTCGLCWARTSKPIAFLRH